MKFLRELREELASRTWWEMLAWLWIASFPILQLVIVAQQLAK